jgi:hypothetical protein
MSGAVDFFSRLPKRLRIWFFKKYLDEFSLHCLKRAYSLDCRPFHKIDIDEVQFINYVDCKAFDWLDIGKVGRFLLHPTRTLPHSVITARAWVRDDDICVFCFKFCTWFSSCGKRYHQIQGEWVCGCEPHHGSDDEDDDGRPSVVPFCDKCYDRLELTGDLEMGSSVDIHGHMFSVDYCYRVND